MASKVSQCSFFLKLAVAVISFVPRPWTPLMEEASRHWEWCKLVTGMGSWPFCWVKESRFSREHMRRHRCVWKSHVSHVSHVSRRVVRAPFKRSHQKSQWLHRRHRSLEVASGMSCWTSLLYPMMLTMHPMDSGVQRLFNVHDGKGHVVHQTCDVAKLHETATRRLQFGWESTARADGWRWITKQVDDKAQQAPWLQFV